MDIGRHSEIFVAFFVLRTQTIYRGGWFTPWFSRDILHLTVSHIESSRTYPAFSKKINK